MKTIKTICCSCVAVMLFICSIPVNAVAKKESVISIVSAGMAHTAVIKADDALYTWGDNSFGQLGTGSLVNHDRPTFVLDNVRSVSCGKYTTAAIRKNNSLYVWGSNRFGMFGNGSANDSMAPIKVADNVLTVSVGAYHTAIITTDGTLYMSGNNNYGQLGTGDTLQQLSFVKIMENCKAVSCGLHHTAVVTDSGELYTFGANNCGQLGNGDAYNVLPLPYPRRAMDNVASVYCGDEHTVAITENGDAYGFGSNEYCQIGAENARGYAVLPQLIAQGVTAASAGMAHSAFALANGNLLMCGKN